MNDAGHSNIMKPEDTAELRQLYADFEAEHLKPLWTQIDDLMPVVPNPKAVPHVWKWSRLFPLAERSGDLVPDGRGGERRAIGLANPGLGGKAYISPTLWAAIQYLGPRETAPEHRHAQNAFRFVVEGEGVWTVVNGDPVRMSRGDLLLTPGWHFHGHHNDTDKPMTVLLQDGSSVVLQPGGRLSYSEGVNRKRREVTLTGKAFFEIVKNKQKPFLVYSYGLATKVLGTSFTIDASSESKDIKVEVRTGTVSVFSINNLDNNQKEAVLDKPELEGVTLNHDQRIAFSKESGRIIQLPAVVAVASDKDVSKQHFVFDETPVSEVFRILENAYNVRIVYDREKMGSCPLNATLIGQPLTEKLEVICNALDAQYEVADNQITILGKGCK